MLLLLLPSPGTPRFSAALTCKLPDNEFRKTFYRGVRASGVTQGWRDEREVKRSTPSCARPYASADEGVEREMVWERDARRRRGINHCLPASGSFNHLLSVKRESRDARKSVIRTRLKRALPRAFGLRLIPVSRSEMTLNYRLQ